MGVAFVRGLQGDDPVYRKLDATAKHLAVTAGRRPTAITSMHGPAGATCMTPTCRHSRRWSRRATSML